MSVCLKLPGGQGPPSRWETDTCGQEQHSGQQDTVAAPDRTAQQIQAASILAGRAAIEGQQQLDAEGIRGAFTPAAVLGIRSLPDALHPGFRLELLVQLQAAERQRVAAVHQQQQRQHSNSQASGSGQQGSGPAVSDGRPTPGGHAAAGSIKVPQRYGPMQGFFSCYPHLTSEYERSQMIEKFARLQSKLAQAGVDDFVVRGCPPPHPHSPTFARYSLDLPPFKEVDYLGRPLHSQQQQQQPPFKPAGRSSSPNVGQLPDVLMRLDAQLMRDWPHSFIKAFVDEGGGVVLSFDCNAAMHEGDLATYMAHQEKHGSTFVEARLAKDPARWGVVEGDGASVFYVLLPPWCRTNKQAMQHN